MFGQIVQSRLCERAERWPIVHLEWITRCDECDGILDSYECINTATNINFNFTHKYMCIIMVINASAANGVLNSELVIATKLPFNVLAFDCILRSCEIFTHFFQFSVGCGSLLFSSLSGNHIAIRIGGMWQSCGLSWLRCTHTFHFFRRNKTLHPP